MSFLTRVGAALDAAKVRYALVGGYAVALHGAVRGTVDVDVILAWNRRTLRAAEQALQGLGLVSRLPITADEVFRFRDEYIRNRNLIAWNFYNPKDLTEQLDVVISKFPYQDGKETGIDINFRALCRSDLHPHRSAAAICLRVPGRVVA